MNHTTTAFALSARHTPDCISVQRGNADGTLLAIQQAGTDQRPYIHPLFAPDGVGVLTENAPPHHRWQHGLYVGLNDVNGVGFWTEGLTGNAADGSFHPLPLKAPTMNGNRAAWSVDTLWCGPKRDAMLLETQAWQLTDNGADYWLDLTWTLAAKVDLTFGKYSYGGLFLRMPYTSERGGVALNSNGDVNDAAEGKRAKWVAVHMPIEGRTTPAGIAIFDHPANAEFPVPWRVDGQLGIAPSRCIAGPWTIRAGEKAVYRHRVYVFCGAAQPQILDANWLDFSRS